MAGHATGATPWQREFYYRVSYCATKPLNVTSASNQSPVDQGTNNVTE
jgi:hypothetical protein